MLVHIHPRLPEVKHEGSAKRWALRIFMLVGLAAVGFCVWAVADGVLYQSSQRAIFESELARGKPQQAVPPVNLSGDLPAAAPAQSEPVALLRRPDVFVPDPLILGSLEISRIDLNVMFREGIDDVTLRRAAGHVPRTALPGETGNMVLIAHRDTLFRPLRNLERGDIARLRTKQGDFLYRVDDLSVVDPSEVSLAAPEGESTLTLITCFPFGYIGPAPRRFVARAHLEAAATSIP